MAVDTRSTRASVLGIGLAAALTLPLSDGTVGQPDRQHVALSYAGIAAETIDAVTADVFVVVGSLVTTVSVPALVTSVLVPQIVSETDI
jgi:hypothetical protein